MERQKSQAKCGLCVCLLLTLLLVILLPLSVVHVDVDKYALPKQRTTGKVTTDGTVWENGEHWAGPDWTTQDVPSRLQSYENTFLLFVKPSGNELPVRMRVLWRQDPKKIHSNFLRFGDHSAVVSRVSTQVEVAIKGKSGEFTMTDYYTRTAEIAQVFEAAVKSGLASVNLGIIVHGLYVIRVDLPDNINDRNLQSAILKESEVVLSIVREGTLYKGETETMVAQLAQQTQLVNTQAIAESNAIINTANAEAAAIKQGAEGRALATFYRIMNITDAETRSGYQEYLTLLRGSAAGGRSN